MEEVKLKSAMDNWFGNNGNEIQEKEFIEGWNDYLEFDISKANKDYKADWEAKRRMENAEYHT